VTGDNIKANVAEEIARGEECLRAADHLCDGGFYNDAVSRAYYAAFHWARALLLTKGVDPRSHRGVMQLISLHFVRTRALSAEAAAALSQLGTFRELSDYNSSTDFTASEARAEIQRAQSFMASCKPLLGLEAKDAPPGINA
jgi:uncharacterized protein (UPF0332 family)